MLNSSKLTSFLGNLGAAFLNFEALNLHAIVICSVKRRKPSAGSLGTAPGPQRGEDTIQIIHHTFSGSREHKQILHWNLARVFFCLIIWNLLRKNFPRIYNDKQSMYFDHVTLQTIIMKWFYTEVLDGFAIPWSENNMRANELHEECSKEDA